MDLRFNVDVELRSTGCQFARIDQIGYAVGDREKEPDGRGGGRGDEEEKRVAHDGSAMLALFERRGE